MKSLKVRVENGKLIGDAPSGLPEGTELELCLAEPEERMTEEELARLNAALEEGWRCIEEGRVVAADQLLATLRSRG